MTKRIYKPLTNEQKEFIDQNKEDKTVQEMAEYLQTTKGKIWRYLWGEKKENMIMPEHFNVNEHDNWIA